jgi:hypothetical protein
MHERYDRRVLGSGTYAHSSVRLPRQAFGSPNQPPPGSCADEERVREPTRRTDEDESHENGSRGSKSEHQSAGNAGLT